MGLSLFSRLNVLRVLREKPAILSALACLLMGLAVGSMFTRQVLRVENPELIQPGQLLTQHIVGATLQVAGVTTASGAYIPGEGMILYSQVNYGDRSLVRAWATNMLIPFADRFSQLPKNEQLTWIIDFPPAGQEVMQASLPRAADAAAYSYVSAPNRLVVSQPTAMVPVAVQAPTEQAIVPIAIPVAPASLPTSEPVVVGVAPQLPIVAATVIPTPAVSPAATIGTPAVLPTLVPVIVASDSFDTDNGKWTALSGKWVVAEGTYVQTEQEGYDYIAVLDTPSLTSYRLAVRLRIDAGEMGGGFVYNMPDPTKRDGAQLIDFANQGRTLRWGHYQVGGAFQYDGGIAIEPAIMDGNWHTFELVTNGDKTEVLLNGKTVANITNLSTSGRVGLTTSRARVAFDDLQLTSQESIQ